MSRSIPRHPEPVTREIGKLRQQLTDEQARNAYLQTALGNARADAEFTRAQIAAHTCPAEENHDTQPWAITWPR